VTFPHKGRADEAKGKIGKSMNETKNRKLWQVVTGESVECPGTNQNVRLYDRQRDEISL
jgi:hypothetical protein